MWSSETGDIHTDQSQRTSWLDEMLNGGLELPSLHRGDNQRSFILLLTGAPGTGKSTFALQLCQNLVSCNQPDDNWLRPLYISYEASTKRVIENAKDFGWCDFVPLGDSATVATKEDNLGDIRFCEVLGSDLLTPVSRKEKPKDAMAELREHLADIWKKKRLKQQGRAIPYDVIVVDSLNPVDEKSESFRDTVEFIANQEQRPRLLVIILDGSPDASQGTAAEYFADGVFRFEGSVGVDNYYTRSFQVAKLRYQSHAWGRHALKIVGPNDPTWPAGTFVFPSVHWHLSRSIRRLYRERTAQSQTKRSSRLTSGFSGLDDIVSFRENADRGFPGAGLTSIVGPVGVRKSYLALNFLVSHLVGISEGQRIEPRNCLLISLHDHEDKAKETLATLLKDQDILQSKEEAFAVVKDLVDSERLRILFTWPGCITPDEFISRVYMDLHRLIKPRTNTFGSLRIETPAENTPSIVVILGLDHLKYKFPLWAREPVFLPALVSMLKCQGACAVMSWALANDESLDATPIAMLSDLLLTCADPLDEGQIQPMNGVDEVTMVTAARVPSGHIGRQRGILTRGASLKMAFAKSIPANSSSTRNIMMNPIDLKQVFKHLEKISGRIARRIDRMESEQ